MSQVDAVRRAVQHWAAMEDMQIHLLSVREHKGQVHARARAVSQQARISIEVWFVAPHQGTKRELWQEARDHVLR